MIMMYDEGVTSTNTTRLREVISHVDVLENSSQDV